MEPPVNHMGFASSAHRATSMCNAPNNSQKNTCVCAVLRLEWNPLNSPCGIDYRFAQFFLCPLFTESATDREVNAVNSEHEKNLPNDSWRLDQVEKSTAKADHPYSQFGTGMVTSDGKLCR